MYAAEARERAQRYDARVLCAERASIQPFANGSSTTASASLPVKACNQFGPDPPQIEGQPASRPTDPDATGGYYQPVRLLVDTGGQYLFTLGETRIACNLPGATAEVLQSYRQFYHLNHNPEIERVIVLTQARPSGITFVSDSAQPEVMAPRGAGFDGFDASGLAPTDVGWALLAKPGEHLLISVDWPSCPETGVCGDNICTPEEGVDNCPADCTTPSGCAGAEPYVSFDLDTRALVPRRESIRISWYANEGAFRDDRTGSTEETAAQTTSSSNDWTAPTSPGRGTLWLVARDSRGGVSWKTLHVEVRE